MNSIFFNQITQNTNAHLRMPLNTFGTNYHIHGMDSLDIFKIRPRLFQEHFN